MGISATFLRGTWFGFAGAALEGRAASGRMARIMNTNVKTLFKWTDGVRIGCLQRTSSGYLSAKTISVVGGLAIPFILTSRSPRVRVFDSETTLVKLCRVRSHQTREALSGRFFWIVGSEEPPLPPTPRPPLNLRLRFPPIQLSRTHI